MRALTFTNANAVSLLMGNGSRYIIESIEGLGTPPVNVQSRKAPTQDGFTYIDTLIDARTLTIEGKINRPKNLNDIYYERRLMESVLTSKIGPGSVSLNIGSGEWRLPSTTTLPGPDEYPSSAYTTYLLTGVSVSGLVFKNKLATEPFQSFLLSLLASDPYFKNPLINNLGLASGWPRTAVNAGDSPAPCTISLIGGTNPTITNSTTGESIGFTYSAGGTIIVSTSFGACTATIGGANAMGNLILGSSFFKLAVGNNVLSLSGGGTATITWYTGYIGI